MTELFIKPRLSTKEAYFKGTVAAGEQVSVKIADPSDALDLTGLRLRIVGNCGETLAQFPEPVEEGETLGSWGEEGGNVTCVLDLCTDKMLAAVPPRATVEFLFVLDDAEDGVLYFKDLCPITHWPMRTGEDVPKNVRDYRDFIAEANETIAEAQNAAQAALATVELYAAEGNGILVQAQNKLDATSAAAASAVEAKNNAEAAVEDAQAAKTAAENAVEAAQAAQAAAESAKDNIETPSTDLTVSGKAADAKTVGDRFAEIENSMSAKADTSALNGLASQSSVNSEAAARAQADAAIAQDISDLSAVKADKSTTYTKEQVDAIVNALKNGRFIVATSLPTVANADKTAIYLIPNSSQQTNDVKDEYIVVGNSWEKIGNTKVDLSGVIKSVNDIGPDGNGNLQLGPSHIGAVPSAVDGVDGYVMTLGGTRYRLGTEYTESGIAGWGTADGTWKLFVGASGAVLLLNNGAIKPTSPANVSGLSKPWTFTVVGIAGGVAGGVVVDDAGKITAEGLYAHMESLDNPHGVTAAQVGAAAVGDVSVKPWKPLTEYAGNAIVSYMGAIYSCVLGQPATETTFNEAYWSRVARIDEIPTEPSDIGAAAADTTYTKTEVDTALSGKLDAMNPVLFGQFSFETTVSLLYNATSGNLATQGGGEDDPRDLAHTDELEYDAANDDTRPEGLAQPRSVSTYKVVAGTPLTITLPSVSASDKSVSNLDLIIDAIGVTTLPAITIQPATGGKAYAVKGTMPEIKADCITIIDATSIPGMNAWAILGASELKEVTNA